MWEAKGKCESTPTSKLYRPRVHFSVLPVEGGMGEEWRADLSKKIPRQNINKKTTSKTQELQSFDLCIWVATFKYVYSYTISFLLVLDSGNWLVRFVFLRQ